MSWDYRIVKIDNKGRGDWFEIREVYYDQSGEITAYTSKAADVSGDNVQELNGTLMLLRSASKRSVLDELELKKHFRKRKREEAKKPAFVIGRTT